MALRNILTIGNPTLNRRSRPVDQITPRILQLLDDMVETMRSAEGAGLAAPQVGVLKRVIVIDVGDGLIELINPEILSVQGEQTDIEGCLSIPEKRFEVTRPMQATVRFQNREGEILEMTGEGLLARAICHEVDHLEGILFLSHVRPEAIEA